MKLYFSKDHEWARLEDNEATVGITEYAVEQLGDVTFVQFPESGEKFKQGDVLCEIESVKAASEIFAPFSGEITELNTMLEDSPETLNNSPEQQGWILKMRVSDINQTDSLMSAGEYADYLNKID
ncbi:MAG: glycine cleavage system protein GcvH [Elusimicrobiota bacterium]